MKSRALTTGWKHAAVAAVVAYALVLQALLLSLGGAFHAAQAAGPQAVLCLQDGQATPEGSPAKTHDGLCCTLSCHGAGPAGTGPGLASFERLAPVAVAAILVFEAPLLRLSSDILPVGSRAPPRLG